MKKLYFLLLWVMIAAGNMGIDAKETWPWVESVGIYSSSNWDEPMVELSKGNDGVWRADSVEISGGTEFKVKLHINYSSGLNVYDRWLGSQQNAVETIKQSGTIYCDYNDNQPNFRIGHSGKFCFSLDNYDLDEDQFSIECKFTPACFLSGEFNNWDEIEFIAWVGDYTLDLDPESDPPLSGEFIIVDQDYNQYGAATDEDYYIITESNPVVQLTSNAQVKKNLYLANESDYSFSFYNGELTVGDWPVETITASIVGSTEQSWNMTNARVIPLTLDQTTGNYVSEETGIPDDFKCQIIRHSSFSSVGDTWYGGSSGLGVTIVPEGGGSFQLTQALGEDITFSGNGLFTFSLAPDFSTLKITGTYNVVPEYFLVGDFNNWDENSKVPFVNNNGEYTLTHTFYGDFLVLDNFGNRLGGTTNEEHYLLQKSDPTVTLSANTQTNKHLYVKDESQYTLTISQGELTVSGWPVETISAWLLGATDDQWEGNELNFELTLDQATGNYVLNETDIPAYYRFQVIKRSSLTSVEDIRYGANSNEDMFSVNTETLGDISLSVNSKDIYFERGGAFTFTVSSDFSNINITGDFDAGPDYYLIGDFNNWDENDMVPFVKRNGIIMLTHDFCGDFLIKDKDNNSIGAAVGNDQHFIFTENGNNVAMSTAQDKKNFCLELPSHYTLTIQGSMLFVSGFPTDGYYISGDFNNWTPEPMTNNGDGTYSIIKSINDNETFKFLDHEANQYGGDTGGNDTYELSNSQCSNVPLTEGDNGSKFIINKGGTYKFIVSEGDNSLSLSVRGFGFINLAEALEGLSGTIDEDLYVADIQDNQVFVTNGTDWVRLDGVFNSNDIQPGYDVDLTQTITEGFGGMGTYPTIAINGWLTYYSDNPNVPSIVEYSLEDGVDPLPKPCQVVKFTGWYFNQDGISVLCASNGTEKGTTIDLGNADGMNDGTMYTVEAAIQLKEPWETGSSGAPRRIKPSDSNALENLVANVIGVPVPTDVITNLVDVPAVSVKYVNVAGQVSAVPFSGVNIVVTTHSDGSTTVKKEIR